MKLKWSKNYPEGANFDWPREGEIKCWLYASLHGVSIALYYSEEDGHTEIDICPIEVFPYATECKCKSLDKAKERAIDIVQREIKRLARKWRIRSVLP